MYVYYIGQRLKRTAQVAMGGGEAADCGGFHRMLGSVSTRFGLVCIYVYLCIYINISVYIYIYIYI